MKRQELQKRVKQGNMTEKQKEAYNIITTLGFIRSCANTGASAMYNADDEHNYDRAIEIILDSV